MPISIYQHSKPLGHDGHQSRFFGPPGAPVLIILVQVANYIVKKIHISSTWKNPFCNTRSSISAMRVNQRWLKDNIQTRIPSLSIKQFISPPSQHIHSCLGQLSLESNEKHISQQGAYIYTVYHYRDSFQ